MDDTTQPHEVIKDDITQHNDIAQSEEAQESEAAKPEKQSLFDLFYGVITKPVETLRHISDNRFWVKGLIIYILVLWISGLASLPSILIGSGLNQFAGTNINPGSARTFAVLVVIITPLFTVFVLPALIGFYHVIASMLKGKGDVLGLLAAIGFASIPQVFFVPFSLLDLIGSTIIGVITSLIQLALAIWVIVLNIIAIRETYRFSTGRAAITFLAPVIILIIVAIILVVFIVAAVMSAVGGLGGLNQLP
ncbi:MAG TPA: Yip1 family protein [Candidatus Aquicultor sp.]|jgi:hypothetical protein